MNVTSSSRRHVGVGGGESFSQQLRPVDIVGSGHRVDSFARVTLVGLSKNHAMTLIHPATTRRSSTRGPTHTPPWWTQPGFVDHLWRIDAWDWLEVQVDDLRNFPAQR